MLIITGSAGYVGKELSLVLNELGYEFIGIDRLSCNSADITADIKDNNLLFKIKDKIHDKNLKIIHLAAARSDYGLTPEEYYKDNVSATKAFLKTISTLNVTQFIHVSSVASLDGENIKFDNSLSCDDAYRATKFLQESLIENWAKYMNVNLTILYPSAIFDDNSRNDTNIGKLQKLSKFLFFIPKIDTKKTLTYLPNFIKFIIYQLDSNLIVAKYLTVERPIKKVDEIIADNLNNSAMKVRIPFLKEILFAASYLLYFLSCFGRFDLGLMPNRVKKLFRDTSYADNKSIDHDFYNKIIEK